jgi:hypothetical protein
MTAAGSGRPQRPQFGWKKDLRNTGGAATAKNCPEKRERRRRFGGFDWGQNLRSVRASGEPRFHFNGRSDRSEITTDAFCTEIELRFHFNPRLKNWWMKIREMGLDQFY